VALVLSFVCVEAVTKVHASHCLPSDEEIIMGTLKLPKINERGRREVETRIRNV
jgi:hypothetical protein